MFNRRGGSPELLVEDVFSADIWTGDGSTQTITNDVNLTSKDGLVWIKRRSAAAIDHCLADTKRGATKYIISNATTTEQTDANSVTAFNSNGYDIGSSAIVNASADTYVGWTFREGQGFFSITEYTGTGSSLSVSHALGVVPDLIIIKGLTGSAADTVVSIPNILSSTYEAPLNGTGAFTDVTTDGVTATSATDITVGVGANKNVNTINYVMYAFADSEISEIGTYTGNGSSTGPTITLGWQPQYVMIRVYHASELGSWVIYDSTRDGSNPVEAALYANTSSDEASIGATLDIDISSTGFQIKSTDANVNTNTKTYMYLAIKAE